MKKSITLLTALFVCVALSAQIKSPKATSIGKSKQLVGAIQPLSEVQSFKLVVPEKLTYWTRTKDIPGGANNQLSIYVHCMKAKQNVQNPDYVFTLVTNGMQNVESGDITPYTNNTKVVPYRYTFPAKLLVSDNQGALLKTFILSGDDDWETCMVTSNFLADVQRPVLPPAGFIQTDAYIWKWMNEKEADILIRMEYNALVSMTELANRVIATAYGYPAMQFKPVVFALDKKDQPAYPELNQAVEQLSASVEKAFSQPIDGELQQELLVSGDFFASQYGSSPKEMTRLCALNAGLAYLLGGDNEKAYTHLLNAYNALGFMSSAYASIDFFADICLMNQLREKKDSDEIVVIPSFSISQHKTMEEEAVKQAAKLAAQQQRNADMAVLQAKNVEEREGYIETKDGEKLEGNISLKFVETSSSNIIDRDLGKVVWLTTNQTKKAYRPKDVVCVVVGDDRYEPVAEAMGAGWQVLGVVATGSNLGGAFFKKLVYKKGNCAVYIDPMITSLESYSILKHPEEKASSFSSLLRNGKAAKAFVGDCPVLQEKLNAKAIKNDEAGARLFVDLLDDCLQQ